MIEHKKLAEICIDSYKQSTISVGECEALVCVKEDVTIIAFRGTELFSFFSGAGWMDIIRDARICPWYDKDVGWAHRGFLSGGKHAANALKTYLDKDEKIILTGHSLGGALSLICAIKLRAAGFNVQEWVGFAAPRSIRRRHKGFKQVNYRYKSDIVPLMPFLNIFRHRYSVVNLCQEKDRCPTWKDHDIELYYNAL